MTISWAQWRVTRNHLPRTSAGSLLGVAMAVIWYGGFTVLAAFIATSLPDAPLAAVRQWLGIALFGVFFFWQIVPLVTLSGGWSLDLKRLQVYPLSTNALLGAEVVLRITAAIEMLLVLIGATIGLAFNPAVPRIAPLALLLFIPFNLLVSLTIRDLLSTAFQKKSYTREIFAVVLIFTAIIPQLFARYYLPRHNGLWIVRILDASITPWHGIAALATGNHAAVAAAVVIAWLAIALGVARWQFVRALKTEETLSSPARIRESKTESFLSNVRTSIVSVFADPTGALIEKELRSLVRMPRFRVVFTLASVFSVLIFLPMQMRPRAAGDIFSQHSIQIMSLYGMLILSDALLWNMFGFDRSATQLYFVTPVKFVTVIHAKNIVAVLFIALQTFACILIALLFRIKVTPMLLVTGLCGAAVAALVFLCIGNISSVVNARVADAKATLRKQSSGVMQLWMLGCAACAIALLGAAYFAGWAANSEWATVAIQILEIGIGLIVYRLSVEFAVERVSRNRERFLSALDKSSSPVSG